jgi:hypothetical protein
MILKGITRYLKELRDTRIDAMTVINKREWWAGVNKDCKNECEDARVMPKSTSQMTMR